MSVQATCSAPGNSNSAWQLQVWGGANCDSQMYAMVSGAASNMDSASCPSVSVLDGPAHIAFKVDCGLTSVLSNQISTGTAYPTAGATTSSATKNVQSFLAACVAMTASVLAVVYLF